MNDNWFTSPIARVPLRDYVLDLTVHLENDALKEQNRTRSSGKEKRYPFSVWVSRNCKCQQQFFVSKKYLLTQCRSVGRGRGGPGPPNNLALLEHSPGLPKTSWLWRSWWAPPIILTLLRHCYISQVNLQTSSGIYCKLLMIWFWNWPIFFVNFS